MGMMDMKKVSYFAGYLQGTHGHGSDRCSVHKHCHGHISVPSTVEAGCAAEDERTAPCEAERRLKPAPTCNPLRAAREKAPT